MRRHVKHLFLTTSLAFFLQTYHLSAVPTWAGLVNNDLTNSNNWLLFILPTNTTTALFDGSNGTFTPEVNVGGVSTLFNPNSIQFGNGSTHYSFLVDAQSTGSQTIIIGDGMSGSVNNTAAPANVSQQFTIQNGGEMVFSKGSTADSGSTGRVNYSLLGTPALQSALIFNGASAGKANIGINTTGVLSGGEVSFGNLPGASAQNCTIDARSNASVIFNNNSTASQSTISLKSGSFLGFSESSDPSAVAINSNSGLVFFNTSVSSTTAQVLLSNSSLATFSSSLELNRIVSDSTSLIDISGTTLTVLAQNDGDTIAGAITGPGGSLVVQGVKELILTNIGNNYSGGTTVTNGTLTVTPAALPTPNVSVGGSGTLNFQGTGTFSGNIADDGVVSTATGATVTLSGDISGNGEVDVSIGSDLTLTGTNSYMSSTFVSGTLHTTPANLPSGVTVKTFSPSGLIIFSGAGTFSGNIADDGTIETASGSTISLSGNINGIGKVVVDDGSDLTLMNTNGYTGGTFVSGTLHSDVPNLPPSGPMTVNAPNGILDLTGSGTYASTILNNGNVTTSSGASSLTLSGLISGTGRVTMNGTGTMTLTGFNTYSGGTFVNSGTLVASSRNLPVSTVQPSATVTGSGKLHFVQPSIGIFAGDISLTSSTASVLTDGAGPLTLSGQISGSGKLVVNTGKAIITNSANNYSGTTLIAAGAALEGTSSSLQGAIRDNGELIFNQTTNGTFTGTISGPSSGLITKLGLGVVTLANSQSAFLGTTNVSQGTLLILNTLGGNVNVLSTGTFGGTGTVGGNLVNSGIVSPGTSIGTLHVNGNYTQNADGTYFVEIDSNGNSDLINVAGTANLNGTLLVSAVNGVIDSQKIYTILHADGGVFNRFALVLPANPFQLLQVIYLPNDVQLGVESVFINVAETYNQMQVAKQLATLNLTNSTPEEQALLFELLALSSSPQTVDAARLALSQMSGEQHTNQIFTGELIGRRFIRRLYNPLREIILNRGTCCERDVYYNCYECDGITVLHDTPWISDPSINMGPWLSISGGHTFMRHNNNASGFNSNNYEFTLGVQTTFADVWTLGIAGSYEYDHLQYNIGGHGNFNSGLGGLYALYRPNSFYILSDLVFDYTWGKVKRPIEVGSLSYEARSNPRFMEGAFYIEFGKDVCLWTGLLFQPFLGFEVNYYAGRKIVESHAIPVNLTIDKKYRTNAFSRLGLHAASTSISCWNFSLDVAWLYRMTSTENRLDEHFIFGNSFDIKGVALPRNSLDFSAYVSTIVFDKWELFAELSGERWSRGGSYDILGGVKFSW